MPDRTDHLLTDHQIREGLDVDELRVTIAELTRLRDEHLSNANRAVKLSDHHRVAAMFLRNAAAYSDRLAVAVARLKELEAGAAKGSPWRGTLNPNDFA